jgi:hypothetical protein
MQHPLQFMTLQNAPPTQLPVAQLPPHVPHVPPSPSSPPKQ